MRPHTFSNSDQISIWAIDAVGKMQTSGIMEGTGHNNFSPASNFTREQSIITILRVFDSLEPLMPIDKNIYESHSELAEISRFLHKKF